jgi:hypothetical protein
MKFPPEPVLEPGGSMQPGRLAAGWNALRWSMISVLPWPMVGTALYLCGPLWKYAPWLWIAGAAALVGGVTGTVALAYVGALRTVGEGDPLDDLDDLGDPLAELRVGLRTAIASLVALGTLQLLAPWVLLLAACAWRVTHPPPPLPPWLMMVGTPTPLGLELVFASFPGGGVGGTACGVVASVLARVGGTSGLGPAVAVAVVVGGVLTCALAFVFLCALRVVA